jgi:hypothetical protein
VSTVVEPGRRCLGDRYELSELIAAGGMGQVWRGRDIALGRPVAVKVLRSEYTGDPTFLARFRAEARLSASLSHPNIARVFDYGETQAQDGSGETLAYLVMELVDGEALSAVLRREGRLDTTTTLLLLRQAAFALAEAHRCGMVHRDVKPGNMLVCADGTVKITDFGIAWSAASVPLTRTGQVIGTPQYLSPEQAEGSLATPASDVYALGLVGYECLTGHTAFDGDNAVTIALKHLRQEPDPLPQELPAGVRELIGRALAKDPAARIPDGEAFVAAIDDAMAGRTVAPATVVVRRPPGRRSPAASGSRRPGRRRVRTVLLPLLALLTGAAIAAGVLFVVFGDTAAPTAVAAQTQHSQTFVLDANDYVGRPVDEVAVQLAAQGLTVRRQPQVTAETAPDLVLVVSPAGVPLSAGDRVVVTYAVAPAATNHPQVVPTQPQTAAPAPSTEAAQEETPSEAAVPSPSETAPAQGSSASRWPPPGFPFDSSSPSTPASNTAPTTASSPATTSPTAH